MSTLQLPSTDEAVFTEDEDDEEYDERQNYEYQERNTEDYRNGDREDYRNGDAENYHNGDTEDYRNGGTEEYHGKYEEDDRERQNNEVDEERGKEHERPRTEHDPDQVTGGYESPPKVAGGEKDESSSEAESQEVYLSICENLRHTLASIKSYSKVNMMGDAKASYFTIGKAPPHSSTSLLSFLSSQLTRSCPAPGRYPGRR